VKSILVTGGTGSFGRAYVKSLLDAGTYDRIVIYSRGEHLQEEMALAYDDSRLRFFIGDVRDESRLEMAMHGVNVVVHAAALKIVPLLEYNPTEAVATNIGGATNVVRASIRAGVSKVVALSTDKAVNPTNLYGATKLAAEKVFVAANALGAGGTQFSVVRYGNVYGSRGSVVPLFKRLAAEGKPLPITDGKMSRFHITMDEAVELVDFALEHMHGREIFVPIIPSVRLIDLAEAISDKHIFIGIRPGEKIYETLISEDEARTTEHNGNVYIIRDTPGRSSLTQAYTSKNNSWWLSSDQITELVNGAFV
jgi:UDP-N-acetylglucosamine 4,6-dehydratase